jgi:hypothetical protein
MPHCLREKERDREGEIQKIEWKRGCQGQTIETRLLGQQSKIQTCIGVARTRDLPNALSAQDLHNIF